MTVSIRYFQNHLTLPPFRRGFHVITRAIQDAMPQIGEIRAGMLHAFVQHTSASLTINENADPTVRLDFEDHFSRLMPEDPSLYRHVFEGPDDMTSHIKASILGSSVSVPISRGRLALGTWQGIYLCEHREQMRRRTLVLTAHGEIGD